MRSLKLILVTTSLTYMTACGLGGGAAGVNCDGRLCTMSESLSLDQSDITNFMSVQSDSVSAQGLLDDLVSLTPQLTLIGTIAPPLVNGAAVQASDITVNGTKVYVAYNTAGNTQAGAVDVIDISNPTGATLASEALYPSMDIHKVTVNSGKLYAAGADGSGAYLQRITLDAAGKLTSTVSGVALRSTANAATPAYAGTSVIVSGSKVFALSGNNGGLSILNTSDLSTANYVDIPDARDISFDSSASSVYVVTGKTASLNAQVKHFDLNGGTVASGNIAALAGAQIDEGKSTIVTGSAMQIVTAGFGGARLNCISSGTTLGLASNPTVSSLTSAEQVANAAAYGGGYMYVANGEAGISVYSINVPLIPSGCTLVSITYLGRLSLGTDASVNNVYYSNGYLVAAVGTKGFKIIKVTTSLLSGLLQAL